MYRGYSVLLLCSSLPDISAEFKISCRVGVLFAQEHLAIDSIEYEPIPLCVIVHATICRYNRGTSVERKSESPNL